VRLVEGFSNRVTFVLDPLPLRAIIHAEPTRQYVRDDRHGVRLPPGLLSGLERHLHNRNPGETS